MALARKKPTLFPGSGELRCLGLKASVRYEIEGDPASLRAGPARLRGSITATPEIAEEAFRRGEGELVLEDGACFRVMVVAHTAGSDTAFLEMRR